VEIFAIKMYNQQNGINTAQQNGIMRYVSTSAQGLKATLAVVEITKNHSAAIEPTKEIA
jgi:hypothetical protein